MKDLHSVQICVFDGSGNLVPLDFAQLSAGPAQLRVTLEEPSILNQAGVSASAITAASDNTDAMQPVGTGAANGFAGMLVVARGTVWNGATWDRNREVAGDAQAATGIPVAHVTLWNGATYDRSYAASAANQSTQPVTGVAIVTGPGNWTLTSAPAAGAQATATRAAGAAGVRHVLTSIAADITASAAQGPLIVAVRDGATGVGTILWQRRLSAQTTPFADARIELSGLNIVGSAATAMTVEFTAAGVATTTETVSATGYDVQ